MTTTIGLVLAFSACASGPGPGSGPAPRSGGDPAPAVAAAPAHQPAGRRLNARRTADTAAEKLDRIEVVFRGGRAYARRGAKEWLVADVPADSLAWSPDARRFAYTQIDKPKAVAALPAAATPAAIAIPGDRKKARPPRTSKARRGARKKRGPPRYRVFVRTLTGDAVADFLTMDAGAPGDLQWVSSSHLTYRVTKRRRGRRPRQTIYMLHAAHNGELVRSHRGTGFRWSRGTPRRLAYIGGGKRPVVMVDDVRVWPRAEGAASSRRRVVGELVWSPDGDGLSFVIVEGRAARLYVILALDNEDGDMDWTLPPHALAGGKKLFWGKDKVIIGTSMLKPSYAVGWKRVR